MAVSKGSGQPGSAVLWLHRLAVSDAGEDVPRAQRVAAVTPAVGGCPNPMLPSMSWI